VCRTPENALVQFKIALLKQQHAEILSAVLELTKLFAGSFEEAAPKLGTARTNLARLITKHLKTEEEELHVPLRARGLTRQIPAFANIAAETRDLRLAYSPISGTGMHELFKPIGQDIPPAHSGFTLHSNG